MTTKRAMILGLDGADPMVVERMLKAGRLPGMQKVIDRGICNEKYDMMGVLPTVTPPNWATLATGNYPKTHGITCYLNHTLGKDLDVTEMNWDSRRVESEYIWEALEKQGKRSIMLNYCGAWPNRVPGSKNIFMDGTGVTPFLSGNLDYQKIVEMKADQEKVVEYPHTVSARSSDCVVTQEQRELAAERSGIDWKAMLLGTAGNASGLRDDMGLESSSGDMPLFDTKSMIVMDFSQEEVGHAAVDDRIYTPIKAIDKWGEGFNESTKESVVYLNKGAARRFFILEANQDGKYDTVKFYKNRKEESLLGEAKVGGWSDWIYDDFEVKEKANKVAYKIRVMEMKDDGSYVKVYVTHVVDLQNVDFYYPRELGAELIAAIGPMMPYANIERFSELGDAVMLETWEQFHDWHYKAAKYCFEKYDDWALFYTHVHAIDLINHWFINQAIPGSHPRWKHNEEVIERIYEINDKFVNDMLEFADDETAVFIVSDHGAIPRSVGHLNPGIAEITGVNGKLLSELGWTNLYQDEQGMYQIDWTTTRAVNNRGEHIYINLKGRDPHGIVEPEDYEATVQALIDDLYSYRDPVTGKRVIAFAMTNEEMECTGLGGKHCGDIFIELHKDFGFEHAMSPGQVSNHGYSLGCLCLMAGGDFKQGEILKRPVRNVDVVPTICHMMGLDQPEDVEGGVLYQALKK